MIGTEIKERFVDTLNNDVSALCVYEIECVAEQDKNNAFLNTVYFQMRTQLG